MAAARPLVSVYADNGKEVVESCSLPAVFTAPIRPDIVRAVFTNMNKNKRQPYSVDVWAGHQVAAESWGTGRAVSRIPRVGGGGTHRSGQGAFGNMCRGGRMFAPTKIWRKWHKKSNNTQKRHAVASALAASALPALVMARGHCIDQVTECPLVVSGLEALTKTKNAVAALQSLGALADVEKVKSSKKLRCGSGKMRNRRYVMRRGPLVVYSEDNGLTKAFRNIPGVELCHVSRMNLLQLAPGGHLGRFVIWTKGAFQQLDDIFGTYRKESSQKTGYKLPRSLMTNSDITRIINSDEVQSVVRPAIKKARVSVQKKNPLRNAGVMARINPYHAVAKRMALLVEEQAAKKAATKPTAAQKKTLKARATGSKTFYSKMVNALKVEA